MGAIFRLWAAMLLLGFAWAQPARAADRTVFDRACVIGADQKLDFAHIRANGSWHCNPAPQDATGRHSWVKIYGSELTGNVLHLESNATVFEGLLLVFEWQDGAIEEHYLDQAELARNWTSGARFSVPIALGAVAPKYLYVRIDDPISPQVATGITFRSPEEAVEDKVLTVSTLGIFVGILAVVALLSGLMARAIRRKFALYHLVFTVLLMIYTVSSTSLIFLVLPDLSLWHRTVISYVALACAMVFIPPFVFDFFEEGTLPPAVKGMLKIAGMIALVGGILFPLGSIWGVYLRHFYHLAFIPGMIAITIAVGVAWYRGSRAARMMVFAWLLPFFCVLERIMRGLDLYTLPNTVDFLFYGAMAFEAFAMTVAIVWRVSDIRVERDRAIQQTEELDQQARHDQLTGLANRRDFDERRWRQSDFLAIIDLDRFKRINDRHGHETGDRVLQAVGTVLSEAREDGEILCAWRLGGEEFAVAMEARSIDDAALIFNAIRGRISGKIADMAAEIDEPVTASAGMSQIGPEVRQAFRAADSALYHAKGGGRNRLCYESSSGALATIFPRPLAA